MTAGTPFITGQRSDGYAIMSCSRTLSARAKKEQPIKSAYQFYPKIFEIYC